MCNCRTTSLGKKKVLTDGILGIPFADLRGGSSHRYIPGGDQQRSYHPEAPIRLA